jgi:hypothetical protein
MYPIEKYKFYTNGKKVIAVSTYAGKTVKGVAICAPGDEFSLDKGKKIAAARCALKIADKRINRASKKYHEADEAVFEAQQHYENMARYLDDAWDSKEEILNHLDNLLEVE